MERNSTNFLRVVALLLVVNSHMDLLYPPKFAVLATGGMMGNALFFMLSGWGLLLSMQAKPRPFGEWYGRRITRIYPSVWVTVVLLSFPLAIYEGKLGLSNSLDEMRMFFFPPFWFLEALMIYYAIIFFVIRKFSRTRLLIVSTAVLAIYLTYYFTTLDLTRFSIESTPFRVIFYFLVMLWGLYLGSESDHMRSSSVFDLVGLALSVACIYGHKYLMQQGLFLSWQWVEHLASFPMLYFFAKIAKSEVVGKIMESRPLGATLTFISGATLEVFMVNNSLDFLDTRLGSFPVNVVALLSINIGLALLIFYCAKPIRRFLEGKASSEPRRSAIAQVSVIAGTAR